MPLTSGQSEYHRLAPTLCTEVKLRAETALTASQCFITSSFARSSRMLMGTNHCPIEKV